MGDVGSKRQEREHLLVVYHTPSPPNLDSIVSQFDYIDIEFCSIEMIRDGARQTILEQSDNVPKDVWRRATMLLTLFALPRTPQAAPHLHYIHLQSAGYDLISRHPFFDDPKSKDVIVTTSSGTAAAPIAEWVLMTTLSLTRQLSYVYEAQKQRQWAPQAPMWTGMGDFVGKTVGILGYGAIGRQVARIFRALGAEIHAYTASPRDTRESRKDQGYRTGDPDGTFPSQWYSGHSQSDLHTFLKSGLHVLVICVPLTKATTHLISQAEFDALQSHSPWPENQETKEKSGAIVVNIARGKIIFQDDLVKALKNGTIKGASLDVADPEPLPKDNELWELDTSRLMLSPHVSSLGPVYISRTVELLRVQLERLEQGKTPFNVVKI